MTFVIIVLLEYISSCMGGNKSKPVAETARTVLMRRSREEVHKVADTGVAASAPSSSAEVSQPQHVPRANTEMDPAILKEMSKWSFVRSSDKVRCYCK